MAAETITTTKSDISLHERAVVQRLAKIHNRSNWRNHKFQELQNTKDRNLIL